MNDVNIQKGKPFLKWAGGKGKLIKQLDALLPADFNTWENATYIEPFVGGGAMLFYMLQAYKYIRWMTINDINISRRSFSYKITYTYALMARA